MSWKNSSFAKAWSRGWRVIFMMLIVQLIGSICFLPLRLFPENLRGIVGLALLLVLGPIICYWGFTLFYPGHEPEPESAGDPEASACAACGTEIPPGKDTCPRCGWTYKTTSV
jgi:hypothetical protein